MPVPIYKDQMTEEAQTKLDGLLALSALQIMLPLEGQTVQQLRTSEAVRAHPCRDETASRVGHPGA